MFLQVQPMMRALDGEFNFRQTKNFNLPPIFLKLAKVQTMKLLNVADVSGYASVTELQMRPTPRM